MNQDEYVSMLKSTALSLGKKAVLDHLISKIPWLIAPFPYKVLSIVVEKILTIAINEGEMGLFFYYIDLRTTNQGREFTDIAIKYRDAEDKTIYEKDLIDSFRKLAKFTS